MPNTKLQLRSGNKVVYRTPYSVNPKKPGEIVSPGLGIHEHCCRCEQVPGCEFNCQFNDSFGGTLGSQYIPEWESQQLPVNPIDWDTAAGNLSPTTTDDQGNFAKIPNFEPSLNLFFWSHQSFGFKVDLGPYWFNGDFESAKGYAYQRVSLFAHAANQVDFVGGIGFGDATNGIGPTRNWIYSIAAGGGNINLYDDPNEMPQPGTVEIWLEYLNNNGGYGNYHACISWNGDIISEGPVSFNSPIYNWNLQFGGGGYINFQDPANIPPAGHVICSYDNLCTSAEPEDFFCEEMTEGYVNPTPDILELEFQAPYPAAGDCDCPNLFSAINYLERTKGVDPGDPDFDCTWRFYKADWCVHDSGLNQCTISFEAVYKVTNIQPTGLADHTVVIKIVKFDTGPDCVGQEWEMTYFANDSFGVYEIELPRQAMQNLGPMCADGQQWPFNIKIKALILPPPGGSLMAMSAGTFAYKILTTTGKVPPTKCPRLYDLKSLDKLPAEWWNDEKNQEMIRSRMEKEAKRLKIPFNESFAIRLIKLCARKQTISEKT